MGCKDNILCLNDANNHENHLCMKCKNFGKDELRNGKIFLFPLCYKCVNIECQFNSIEVNYGIKNSIL